MKLDYDRPTNPSCNCHYEIDELRELCGSLSLRSDHAFERIEKLESTRCQEHLSVNTGAIMGLQKRIEKLESDLEEAMKMEWTSTPLNNLAVQYSKQNFRIREIEDRISCPINFNHCVERIDKLEDESKSLHKYISECDQARLKADADIWEHIKVQQPKPEPKDCPQCHGKKLMTVDRKVVEDVECLMCKDKQVSDG